MDFSLLFKRKPKKEEVERLKDKVRQADSLKRLKTYPEWTDFLVVTGERQDYHGRDAVNPLNDEKTRFSAACRYAELQHLLVQMNIEISEGEKARKQLEELVGMKK